MYLLIITENGFIQRINLNEFPDFFNKGYETIFSVTPETGNVVSTHLDYDSDTRTLILVTQLGDIHKFSPQDDIELSSTSDTKLKEVVNLKTNDKVVSSFLVNKNLNS